MPLNVHGEPTNYFRRFLLLMNQYKSLRTNEMVIAFKEYKAYPFKTETLYLLFLKSYHQTIILLFFSFFK